MVPKRCQFMSIHHHLGCNWQPLEGSDTNGLFSNAIFDFTGFFCAKNPQRSQCPSEGFKVIICVNIYIIYIEIHL